MSGCHYCLLMQFLQSHNDVFMLVCNGTRVALKANPLSPMTEPPGPAGQTTNADLSAPADPGATEQKLGLDLEPEPEPEVQMVTFCSIPKFYNQKFNLVHCGYLCYCFRFCLTGCVFLSISRVATGLTLMIPR